MKEAKIKAFLENAKENARYCYVCKYVWIKRTQRESIFCPNCTSRKWNRNAQKMD